MQKEATWAPVRVQARRRTLEEMQAWMQTWNEDAQGLPVVRRLAGQFEHMPSSAFQPQKAQAVALERDPATPAAHEARSVPAAPRKPFRSLASEAYAPSSLSPLALNFA